MANENFNCIIKFFWNLATAVREKISSQNARKHILNHSDGLFSTIITSAVLASGKDKKKTHQP